MPDWKRCEDEMPPNGHRVIVKGFTMLFRFDFPFVGEASWTSGIFKKHIWRTGGSERVYGVTHWQPLPAPPEEETP